MYLFLLSIVRLTKLLYCICIVTDNADSEFHVNAKYVNSTAVSAEVFHVVNRQRITDVLTTVRLNNSHLLHSRLHWRPAMVNDFKVNHLSF